MIYILIKITYSLTKIQFEGAAKTAHHIVPAIHRARAFTEDESEGYQKSEIAVKTNKGTKFDNVERQSTAGKSASMLTPYTNARKQVGGVKYFPVEVRSRCFNQPNPQKLSN